MRRDLCRTEFVRHIGHAHALHVIHTATYPLFPTDDLDARIEWSGADRGVEREIVAVELPDLWLVVHVMPTALRTP